MEIPLQLKVRDMTLKEETENKIRNRVQKLGKVFDRITHCRVVVEAPHRHHKKGRLCQVSIYLTVPGNELVIKREPNTDLRVAIRDAFDVARRRLEDYSQRLRGDVKNHDGEPEATVSKINHDEGYGFLTTAEGDEIYFHQNSVSQGAFNQIDVGAKVRFSAAQGEQGPQASTVKLA